MAKVLVAYASRLGGTRGIAEAIGAGLTNRGHSVVVRSVDDPSGIDEFDGVVLGSGVFAGHWHKPAVEFARRYEQALAMRPVWLFSSGPIGDSTPKGPFPDAKEVGAIRDAIRPREHRIFWGALDRSALGKTDLGVVTRFITRRFIPEGDWRDWPAIDAWAESISGALRTEVAVPA